jgi:hypothetical protein
MAEQPTIYRSGEGEVWYLVPDTEGHRLRIRYQPKHGQASLVELDAFLSEEHGPQHEALPRLLQDIGYLLPGGSSEG